MMDGWVRLPNRKTSLISTWSSRCTSSSMLSPLSLVLQGKSNKYSCCAKSSGQMTCQLGYALPKHIDMHTLYPDNAAPCRVCSNISLQETTTETSCQSSLGDRQKEESKHLSESLSFSNTCSSFGTRPCLLCAASLALSWNDTSSLTAT